MRVRLLLVAVLSAAIAAGCTYHASTGPSSTTTLPSVTEPHDIQINFVSGVGAAAGTATITARVLNMIGAPLAGISVAFSTDAGTLSAAQDTTDKDGEAHTKLQSSTTATVKVTVGSIVRTSPIAVQQKPPEIAPPPPPIIVPPTPPTPPPVPPPPSPSYAVTVVASPTSVLTGTSATVTATATAQNGAPAAAFYDWDCKGDGVTIVTTGAPTNTFNCTYPTAGTISSRVTVRGGTAVGAGVATVTVAAPAITVSCDSPTLISAIAATCVVSATVNAVAVPSAQVTSVTWDWGDSTTSTFASNVGTHSYSAAVTFHVVATATVSGSTATGPGTAVIR